MVETPGKFLQNLCNADDGDEGADMLGRLTAMTGFVGVARKFASFTPGTVKWVGSRCGC